MAEPAGSAWGVVNISYAVSYATVAGASNVRYEAFLELLSATGYSVPAGTERLTITLPGSYITLGGGGVASGELGPQAGPKVPVVYPFILARGSGPPAITIHLPVVPVLGEVLHLYGIHTTFLCEDPSP